MFEMSSGSIVDNRHVARPGCNNFWGSNDTYIGIWPMGTEGYEGGINTVIENATLVSASTVSTKIVRGSGTSSGYNDPPGKNLWAVKVAP
jgi:hypothetical protein